MAEVRSPQPESGCPLVSLRLASAPAFDASLTSSASPPAAKILHAVVSVEVLAGRCVSSQTVAFRFQAFFGRVVCFQPQRHAFANLEQLAGFAKGIEPDHSKRAGPSADHQLREERHNPLLF